MRALILADRPNWSYMQIAQAIQRHNPDPDLTIDVMALKGRESEFLSIEKRYSKVLIMGWQMCESRSMRRALDGDRWLTGVHSHHSFDQDLLTTPDDDVAPPWPLILFLRKFRGVNVVSERLHRLFSDETINTAPTHPQYKVNPVYTPNGVDTDAFKPMVPLTIDGPLRVGVAYTPKHDRRKGVEDFIRPACEKAGAILVEAKARSEQHVKPEDMPAWYRGLDVYCCMSSSEGFSIAVLEAAASGVPVISTRVGGSTELIEDHKTGFLIPRDRPCLIDTLEFIRHNRDLLPEMGREIRQVVEDRWAWENRAPAWLAFLRA